MELLPPEWRSRPEIGKKVAVIGGGDTASDCLRTALRLGADEVTCLYRRTIKEMPGGGKDRELALEEGAHYQFLTQPVKFMANETGATARPGVFAGGDDVTGPDLVVTAMVAGRKAAAAIDKYLQSK